MHASTIVKCCQAVQCVPAILSVMKQYSPSRIEIVLEFENFCKAT